MREISPLQKERLNYQPKLAGALANGINAVKLALGNSTTSVADEKDVKELKKYLKKKSNINFDIQKSVLENEYIFTSVNLLFLNDSLVIWQQVISVVFFLSKIILQTLINKHPENKKAYVSIKW